MDNISVIIKTKNSDETLCETLESVKNFGEIIIIDNNSSDDTIDIAKEYRAKIIYDDDPFYFNGLQEAIQQTQKQWIFILEDNEIIPKNLASKIEQFIKNNKKNITGLTFSAKTIYLEKEVKIERQKKLLRLYKKEYIDFKSDGVNKIYLKKEKLYKLNKNFKLHNCSIIKYIKPDIIDNLISETIKYKNEYKNSNQKPNFLKIVLTFIYYYVLKGGIFDSKNGFIFAYLKAYKEFVANTMMLEKIERMKNDNR